MKKIIVCVLLAFCCLASNAQVKEPIVKKSYKELKPLYNPREYVSTFSDKYSPGWSGVASFFIPGLGEAICGEWGRAAIPFFGNVLLTSAGQALVADENGAGLVCYAAAIALDIWSVFDAVKIAKVKNMYYQDASTQSSINFKFTPYLANVNTGINSTRPVAGMSFCVSF